MSKTANGRPEAELVVSSVVLIESVYHLTNGFSVLRLDIERQTDWAMVRPHNFGMNVGGRDDIFE